MLHQAYVSFPIIAQTTDSLPPARGRPLTMLGGSSFNVNPFLAKEFDLHLGVLVAAKNFLEELEL